MTYTNPLPRLTEIGDTFTGLVTACIPEGEEVVFQFEGYDEPMRRSRFGVDGAFLRMEYCFAADRKGDEPIIDYAGVVGDRLTFKRTKPQRGNIPAWRIEKAVPLPPAAAAVPPVPTVPKLPPLPPTDVPAQPVVMPNANGKLPLVTITPEIRVKNTASPTIRDTIATMTEADRKRAEIHTAFERELTYVLGAPLALVRKKKAEKNFDVNAAVSFLLIEQAKRGCL